MNIPALDQLGSYAHAATDHIDSRLVLAVGVVLAVVGSLAFFVALVVPIAVLTRYGVLPGVLSGVLVYGTLGALAKRHLSYYGLVGRASRDGGDPR